MREMGKTENEILSFVLGLAQLDSAFSLGIVARTQFNPLCLNAGIQAPLAGAEIVSKYCDKGKIKNLFFSF